LNGCGDWAEMCASAWNTLLLIFCQIESDCTLREFAIGIRARATALIGRATAENLSLRGND
jgi:hypothetical protein